MGMDIAYIAKKLVKNTWELPFMFAVSTSWLLEVTFCKLHVADQL